MRFSPRLRRLYRRQRTIWPTREGWWFLLVTMGLGVAAVNTGNNLLYLLISMLLGLIVVSGILSELAMRGVRITRQVPDEIYAGHPAVFGATVANRKRRVPSYSLTIEVLAEGRPARLLYVLKVSAGAARLFTWQETLPRRGRQRLAGLRVTTLFPFGLFLKAGIVILESEVIVYPAVHAIAPGILDDRGLTGSSSACRRGASGDLYNIREYRAGDDPRLVHWRTTAKSGVLMVRELEAETTVDARVVLERVPGANRNDVEDGISRAASIAVHVLREGARVELVGRSIFVPLAGGAAQERAILTALALYDADTGGSARVSGTPARLREIAVRLG